MSEWWTYRPSDFLMFSARTYGRLFELANAASWPLQPVLVGVALVWWLACLRLRHHPLQSRPQRRPLRTAASVPVAFIYIAFCWGWMTWAFVWQRYAAINWAAPWLAAGFALQGMVLLALAFDRDATMRRPGLRRSAGLLLIGWALIGHPLAGWTSGQSATGLEWIAIAPDPTLIATLGLLLTTECSRHRGAQWARYAAWALSTAAAAIGIATLATMGSPMVASLAIAAVLSIGTLGFDRRAA